MRLVIITQTSTVGKNNLFYNNLDLSDCGIPVNVWALQWEEWEPNKGHIEFNSSLIPNQDITSLPEWANSCLQKWQEAYDAEQAAMAVATNNQPTTQGTQTL